MKHDFLPEKYNLKMQGENHDLLPPSVLGRIHADVSLFFCHTLQDFQASGEKQGADVYFSDAGPFSFLQGHKVTHGAGAPGTQEQARWTVGKLELGERPHPSSRREPKCGRLKSQAS